MVWLLLSGRPATCRDVVCEPETSSLLARSGVTDGSPLFRTPEAGFSTFGSHGSGPNDPNGPNVPNEITASPL